MDNQVIDKCGCEFEYTLRDVMSSGGALIYSTITQLHNLAKKTDLTDKEKSHMNVLNVIATAINDAIHPGHNIWAELDPISKQFIDHCIANQKEAIEKGFVNNQCKCNSCKAIE